MSRPKHRAVRSSRTTTPKLPPASTLRIQKLGARRTLAMAGAKAANTIVYIHGIGNKPLPSVLKCQWDRALFGIEQGERSRDPRVNRELYPTPLDATCSTGDNVRVDDDEMPTRTVLALSTGRAPRCRPPGRARDQGADRRSRAAGVAQDSGQAGRPYDRCRRARAPRGWCAARFFRFPRRSAGSSAKS